MKVLLAATALALLATAAGGQTPPVSGEVTKLDRANKRITLRHGEIKNLDMPPMTMSFRVRDGQLIESVAVGDRVRFTAERLEGQYVVTSLAKAPN